MTVQPPTPTVPGVIPDDHAYQWRLNALFAPYRGPGELKYPPYGNTPNLEVSACRHFMLHPPVGRCYIPVFWNAYYERRRRNAIAPIQPLLDRLDPGRAYFTVANHSEAVAESLPRDTAVFSATGLRGGIPIPQVTEPIADARVRPASERDLFCSFVGAVNTHPLRKYLVSMLRKDEAFTLETSQWTATPSPESFRRFTDTTARSRFGLCPRGFSLSSYRLYECMQFGTVPVYVSDHFHLPYADRVDWETFCVLVRHTDIPTLGARLRAIDPATAQRMGLAAKAAYDEHFAPARMLPTLTRMVADLRPLSLPAPAPAATEAIHGPAIPGRKIRLLVPVHQSDHPERRRELEECLRRNKANPWLEVVEAPSQERPTYADLFAKANALAQNDDITLIANADICFDHTIQLALDMAPGACYALSRWEVDAAGHAGLNPVEAMRSQDAWIFRGRIRPVQADFPIGVLGCDNRLCHELETAGYAVSNPARSIVARHLHRSGHRTYRELPSVPGPHKHVVPTHLPAGKPPTS